TERSLALVACGLLQDLGRGLASELRDGGSDPGRQSFLEWIEATADDASGPFSNTTDKFSSKNLASSFRGSACAFEKPSGECSRPDSYRPRERKIGGETRDRRRALSWSRIGP